MVSFDDSLKTLTAVDSTLPALLFWDSNLFLCVESNSQFGATFADL